MIRLRWLILVALLSALVSGVLSAPAPYIFAWLAPSNLPVTLSGMDGTLRQGTLRAVAHQGRVVARDVSWGWRPTSLLRLGSGWNLRFAGPVTGEAALDVSIGGQLSVSKTRAVGDLSAVMAAAGFGGLPLQGQIAARIQQLRLDGQGRPNALQGHAELRRLRWAVGREPLVIGDFRADLATAEDGALVATISAPDSSPVEATGEAFLQPDGSYRADVRVRARDSASEQVRGILGIIGQPDAQGYYRLRQRGRL